MLSGAGHSEFKGQRRIDTKGDNFRLIQVALSFSESVRKWRNIHGSKLLC